jgi:hypothetical protein
VTCLSCGDTPCRDAQIESGEDVYRKTCGKYRPYIDPHISRHPMDFEEWPSDGQMEAFKRGYR